MIEFFKNFFWEGFQSGNFEYKTTHIIAILITIASAILIPLYLKNKDEKTTWRFLRSLAALTLVTYVLRRVIRFSLNGDYSFQTFISDFWLFYLCNVNTVLLSLMLLFKRKKGYEFVMITGFIGGVVTFLIPDGIYTDKYLTFSIFDSIISHYILIVVPAIFIVKDMWRPNFSRVNEVVLGMLLVIMNVEIVQRLLLGGNYTDYLFFHGDIPFAIPGRPDLQFIVISVLFLVVLAIIYSINQIIITSQSKKLGAESVKLKTA